MKKIMTHDVASILPSAEESFRLGWQEAMRGETRPISELWDELFATPESEVFLTQMITEVRREEDAGKLIEGGWDKI
ncbi:MAG: hypothetical protein EAZ92_11835 [Candidatus Kapaibacterium sp.]|nr:MAG: hypothetical protein EAZ92_11835 [Candidatus Kapabacteria bacterium]